MKPKKPGKQMEVKYVVTMRYVDMETGEVKRLPGAPDKIGVLARDATEAVALAMANYWDASMAGRSWVTPEFEAMIVRERKGRSVYHAE